MATALVPVPSAGERPLMWRYDPEIAAAVCERIAHGETMISIAKDPGWPSQDTLNKWLITVPEFRSALAMSREISAYALEEEAMEAVRRLLNPENQTQVSVRAAEVVANQLRWSATKRNSMVYGEHGRGNIVVPIQINTTLDLGQEGGAKAAHDPSAVYTVTAKVPKEALGEGRKVTPLDVALEALDGTIMEPAPKPKAHRGLKKGQMTEEHKAKLVEGRRKAMERRYGRKTS